MGEGFTASRFASLARMKERLRIRERGHDLSEDDGEPGRWTLRIDGRDGIAGELMLREAPPRRVDAVLRLEPPLSYSPIALAGVLHRACALAAPRRLVALDVFEARGTTLGFGLVRAARDAARALRASRRALPPRQDLEAIHARLGIDPGHAGRRGMSPVREPCVLAHAGIDVHGREQWLERGAARAWHRMRRAAARDGVELALVSAFRTVAYQAGIVERKLARGDALDAILRVNAVPGYSEHHSGRAIDVTTPGYADLEEAFEHSPAFAWLDANAARFGYAMSYPRGNLQGIAYEPWHWAYRGGGARA